MKIHTEDPFGHDGTQICHSIIKLNLLSFTDCLMIVIMVALPQLICGRATCTCTTVHNYIMYKYLVLNIMFIMCLLKYIYINFKQNKTKQLSVLSASDSQTETLWTSSAATSVLMFSFLVACAEIARQVHHSHSVHLGAINGC